MLTLIKFTTGIRLKNLTAKVKIFHLVNFIKKVNFGKFWEEQESRLDASWWWPQPIHSHLKCAKQLLSFQLSVVYVYEEKLFYFG